MINASFFLISRSFVNRTKARLQRLKKPKYLIGAIFGFIYLYFYFFQFLFMRGRRAAAGGAFNGDASILPLIGVTILFVMVVSAWIFPHARAALVFSEAEIAFLFPAPISRRMLVHFKLLRSQLAILFTVLLLTLITGRFLIAGHPWMRVLGWWVILSTLNLHFIGASFARSMLLEHGISNWIRRTIVLLLLAALVVATIVWARQTLPVPTIATFTDWPAWRDYARDLLGTPPLSYLLYPFRLVIAPYLAQAPLEFGRALLPALGIMALHYIWVIRSNVAFEEASLEVSRRLAERVSAMRQGRGLQAQPKKGTRAPFQLSPTGFAPIAFLWKNLIHARVTFRARTLLLTLLPIFVAGAVIGRTGARGGGLAGAASILLMMFFFWSLLIGAQFVRCDFRQDLNAMDVIKLFPLRGWQIVAGELLAPLVILTIVQWLMLCLAAILMATTHAMPMPPLPWIWVACTVLLAPFWNGLTLLIPNAAVLLFPGWFQTRADTPQGIEVTGQRLLLFFGQLVVLGVAILPAGLAFTVGFTPLYFAGAKAIAPLAGAGGAAIALAGEIVLGVWLVGKLFDRFDLAAEQSA